MSELSNFDGQVSYQPLDEVSNMIRGCKTGNFSKSQMLVYATCLMTDTVAGLQRQTWKHYIHVDLSINMNRSWKIYLVYWMWMSSSPSGMTVSNHQCQRLNFTINLGNLIEQSFERGICVYFLKKRFLKLWQGFWMIICINWDAFLEKETIVKTTGILGYWDNHSIMILD